MQRHSLASGKEAAASALAMLMAADGRVDEREILTLAALDAFRRLAVTRQRLLDLANQSLDDTAAQRCGRLWLSAADRACLDKLLDAVPSQPERLLVCRLAAAVVTADGRVTPDERLVYDHMLARWGVTQSMVTDAILHDRRRYPCRARSPAQ